MIPQKIPVAIVGAGPAGSTLAHDLAKAGQEVALFHRPLNKHCGGGMPARAFDEFPWLNELPCPCREVYHITIIAPSNRSLELKLSRPLRVYNRSAFDKALRQRAIGARCTLIDEGVRQIIWDGATWRIITGKNEYRASFLVGADGASSLVRRSVSSPFSQRVLSLCAGYYPHSTNMERVVVGYPNRARAYMWLFPGIDSISAGIVAPLANVTASILLKELRAWIATTVPGEHPEFSKPFAALLPVCTGKTTQTGGGNWALIGDAAGVAEPVTREGIYYAIHSAAILARTFIDGDPARYPGALALFLKEKHRAAIFASRYLFTSALTEQLVRLSRRNDAARGAYENFFSEDLNYRELARQIVCSISTHR